MIFFILAGLLVGGIIYQYVAKEAEKKKYKPLGRMIEVEGHKMHIFAQGEEGPTVVITGGLGTSSPFIDFYRVVDELSKHTRAVVYERPGYGWSESAKTPRNVEQITFELYNLLHKAKEKPPFLFVAHSFGSLEVIHFAQKYPKLVLGILFVDAGNPTFYQNFKTHSFKAVSYITKFITYIGLLRSVGNIIERLGVYKPPVLPVDILRRARMMFYSNWFNNDSIRELDVINDSAKYVLSFGNLGDIPLTVLSAGNSISKIKGWRESQEQLTTLSTRSQHKIITNVGHGMPVTHPEIVVKEILHFLSRL